MTAPWAALALLWGSLCAGKDPARRGGAGIRGARCLPTKGGPAASALRHLPGIGVARGAWLAIVKTSSPVRFLRTILACGGARGWGNLERQGRGSGSAGSRTLGIERGKPERGESGQGGRASNRGWLGWGCSPLRGSVAKQSGRLFTACSEPSALRPATLRRDPCSGYRCALVGPLLFWAIGSGEEVEEANQQVSGRSGRHVAGVSDLRSACRRLRVEGNWCASAWERDVWVCAREVVLGKRFCP